MLIIRRLGNHESFFEQPEKSSVHDCKLRWRISSNIKIDSLAHFGKIGLQNYWHLHRELRGSFCQEWISMSLVRSKFWYIRLPECNKSSKASTGGISNPETLGSVPPCRVSANSKSWAVSGPLCDFSVVWSIRSVARALFSLELWTVGNLEFNFSKRPFACIEWDNIDVSRRRESSSNLSSSSGLKEAEGAGCNAKFLIVFDVVGLGKLLSFADDWGGCLFVWEKRDCKLLWMFWRRSSMLSTYFSLPRSVLPIRRPLNSY